MIYFIFAVQFLKMQNVKCKYYQLIPFLTFDKDIDVACEQGFENKIRRNSIEETPFVFTVKSELIPDRRNLESLEKICTTTKVIQPDAPCMASFHAPKIYTNK